MADISILDKNIDDVVEPRRAPDGEYLAIVAGVKFDKIPNEKETPYADLEFRLQSPMDNQDLTGVNLSRSVYGRVWLSDNAIGGAKRDLKKFGVDVAGLKLRDAFEKIIGATAAVRVQQNKYKYDKKGVDEAEVGSWRQA